MFFLLILLPVLQIISPSFCFDFSKDDHEFSMVNCFAQESRISELLRLKRSLEKISLHDADYERCTNNKTCAENPATKTAAKEDLNSREAPQPAALALTAEKREYEGDASALDYNSSWQHEEKPSKLQTLFQITITSLSFLSFGGYLLCLIVQAIKSKGTTYFHPIATTTMTTNNGVKRIKIYRRGRRNAEAMEREDLLMALPSPADLSEVLFKHGGGFLRMVDKI